MTDPTTYYFDLLKLQLDWVRTADGKVAPLFAIDLALLGSLASTFGAASDGMTSFALVTSGISAGFLVLSSACLALTGIPRLEAPHASNVFFGGISKLDSRSFIEQMRSQNENALADDLLLQIHRNAQIAAKKYGWISKAYWLAYVGAVFWFPALYLLWR